MYKSLAAGRLEANTSGHVKITFENVGPGAFQEPGPGEFGNNG